MGIIGKKKIDAAEDPEAERKAQIKQYEDKFMNPYVAAERGYIDEVIRPEETKQRVVDAFAMLEQKSKQVPDKKHGNIPL